jgi:hypothetical protein
MMALGFSIIPEQNYSKTLSEKWRVYNFEKRIKALVIKNIKLNI